MRARQFGVAVLAALALIAIASVALRFVAPDDAAQAVASPSTMRIDAAYLVAAGASINVQVAAPVADRTDVNLGVFSALESTLLQASASNGVAKFVLEPQLLDHAGRVTLVAQVGATRSVHDLIVEAGEPVAPIVPLVGPRTIVADSQDFTMVVISPTDEFGNPVADGTTVATQVVRPDGAIDLFDTQVTRGLTALELRSSTSTGPVSITSQIADRQGPARKINQVAGSPADFSVEAGASLDEDQRRYADGFTLFEVSTSELRDDFGNLLPDGVVVSFEAITPNGSTFAQSTVQGGYATVHVEAPSAPGDVVVLARAGGRESAPLVLPFDPAVSTLLVEQSRSADGTLVVNIGPVTTVLGGYPADGTNVVVRDPASGEILAQDALFQGAVEVPLRRASESASPVSFIEIEILGASSLYALTGGA